MYLLYLSDFIFWHSKKLNKLYSKYKIQIIRQTWVSKEFSFIQPCYPQSSMCVTVIMATQWVSGDGLCKDCFSPHFNMFRTVCIIISLKFIRDILIYNQVREVLSLPFVPGRGGDQCLYLAHFIIIVGSNSVITLSTN